MAEGNKRKLAFLLVRILFTVGLIGYIYTRIDIHDKVFLKDGGVVEGKLVRWDEEVVVIVPKGEEEAIEVSGEGIVRRKDGSLSVNPGFVRVFTESRKHLLVVSFLAMGVCPAIAAVRWKILLKTQGIELGYVKSAKLCLIGQFFNNFLLGLTGGDIMKAYLLTRETERKAKAALSVFVDRVVGMMALAFVSGAFVTMNLRSKELREAAIFIYAVLGFLGVLLLVVGSKRFRRLVRVRKVLRIGPLRKLVGELDEALTQYRDRKHAIAIAFVLSLAAHAIMIAANYGTGRALGIAHLGLVPYFTLVPTIIIISAVPISLAGWGWGETLYTYFFGTMGVPGTQAVALSVAVRLYQVGWSLLGAAFYVFGGVRRGRKGNG